ncbi:E6 [Macaca mulatta papillomavirus 6]|uniref:E6 n=1 Tax=Macaca mulatta papillomavirus 6 TaxID=2364646 RepID=UPI000EB759E0|nr:E6 [Macaca mulatta papillomavirus 6]AYD74605.1 E6 [Macaca mulatta papillomavirus 6]
MSSGTGGRPRTLQELCTYCNLSFDSLHITCVFCSKALTLAEAYAFQYKDLFVVWRAGLPFAACAFCLEVHGEIRKKRHREYASFWYTVEQECGEKLENIYIRCYRCHKPLCWVEKQRHITHGRRFHRVSGHWKGRCLQCWKPECTERRLR